MDACRRGFLQKATGSVALAASALRRAHISMLVQNSDPARNTTLGSLDSLRAQFPGLQKRINGHPLVYLDSAATTQRHRAVIDAVTHYYVQENANPSKSLHTLARRSATIYDQARDTVARFLNAHAAEEIMWTRGTTEAINLVASSWGSANLRPGDEIILTVAEHYSNLVPWQLAARRANIRVRIVDVEDDGRLRLDQLEKLLSERTRLVAFSHASNVLGLINPVKEFSERAHRLGALVLVDGAQSAPHFPIDVQELGCDFFAFSGHKILGPMGIGVLWARQAILEGMWPYQAGSNMAHDVELESTSTAFAKACLKFEAGTPNVPGAVGLAAALEFVQSLDRKALWAREQALTRYALSRLRAVKGLRILGPTESKDRISVFSFVMENGQPLDVVKTLDAAGIAVRGGDLAALPLLKRMGATAAVRASCYLYTTEEEVDRLTIELSKIARSS